MFNNRGVNAAHCALSGQPIFGGPAYYFRNVLYHVGSGPAFKFMAKPAGLLVYHNTVITENRMRDLNSNAHFRNNLFLGTDTEGRNIASFPNATSYSTFDYNGYRPNRGVDEQYIWLAPENGKLRDYELDMKQARAFKTLRELTAATGQESHGIEVDYDIFENLPQPEPGKIHAVYYATDLNFQLKPGSKAVDAGVVLPTINDDFSGKAPDLGALEAGKPAPVYGPRGAKTEASPLAAAPERTSSLMSEPLYRITDRDLLKSIADFKAASNHRPWSSKA